MKNLYLKILLTLLLKGIMVPAFSQVYPIQVTTHITPPYSLHLADYASPGTNKFSVFIILPDPNITNYKVVFQLHIEGNGFAIRSNPNVIPQPITLDGNVPQILSGSDLASYFDPKNLIFEGINRNQFLATGRLPEGVYNFYLKTYDYNRFTIRDVSQLATLSVSPPTIAWLILNDPPLINLPHVNEKVRATEPQNVIFQWTPRHTASPNSAFSAKYLFEIWEIWPEDRNPNVIAMSTLPIYQIETYASTLIYGLMEPTLEPGRSYAYRIKAFDTQGMDLFKNNGYSEVQKFTFGDECKLPLDIEAESLTDKSVKITWDANFGHSNFILKYREKDVSGAEWFTNETFMTSMTLYDLKPATQYEYQLKGMCGTVNGDFSEIYDVWTSEKELEAFECGQADPIVIENKTLINSLSVNEYIYAGGFKLRLTEIKKEGNSYSGKGEIAIPFLDRLRFDTKFKNVKINEEKQLYEGKVNVIGATAHALSVNQQVLLDNTFNEIEDIIDEADNTLEEAGNIVAQAEDAVEEAQEVYEQVTDAVNEATEFIAGNNNEEENNQENNTGTIDTPLGEVAGGTDVQTNTNNQGGSVNSGTINNDTNLTDNSNDTVNEAGTYIGFDHKAGDQVQFGYILITYVTDPVKDSNEETCIYSVEKTDLILKFSNEIFGEYSQEINNASLKYELDCDNGILVNASINWNNSTGLPIEDIGTIDALLTNLDLTIDNEGLLDGQITFNCNLKEDKSADLFIIKKEISGTFNFIYEKAENDFAGNFNFDDVNNINIDIIKKTTTIASLTNGSLNSSGEVSGNVSIQEEISYLENGFDLQLKKLDANITCNIATKDLIFNTISGKASIKEIPGSSESIDIEISKAEKQIIASLQNIENIKLYGLNIEASNIKVYFNNKFEIEKLTGKDINAIYASPNESTSAKGALNISEITIDKNELQTLSGSGTLAYPPYTEIKLSNGEYSNSDKLLVFGASVDLEANEENQVQATVNEVRIAEDGTIELGEISIDLITTIGPLTVEFESEPQKANKVKTINAKVSLQIKENDINEKISFETKVDYKKPKDQPINYIKIDITDLDIDFPEIYGISNKLKSVYAMYEVDEENNKTFEGKATFTSNLSKDKSIYQDIIVLKKGLKGDIAFNFDYETNENMSGNFDLSNLSGLKIDLVRNEKSIATLGGNFSSKGVLTGTFKASGVEYTNKGFKTTLDKFDVKASYNIKSKSFKFLEGLGQATISEITGINGSFTLGLEYQGENFTSIINAEDSDLSFCSLKISDFALEVKMDSLLNLERLEGGFSIKHPDINTALKINKVIIENGELKELDAKSNIDYKKFKFDITDAVYKDHSLTCSAKVLLSDNYVAVDKLKIKKDGKISVGKVEGKIKKSIMAIEFEAAFSEDRFQGAFDATLSKKLSFSGAVDMGSSSCDECIGGSYPFGYYSLKVGAQIPIFPGISISKLGGQFGYNYYIDFESSSKFGEPKKGNYLAGLSFGLQDQAGLVEVAIDPAIFQWSDKSASLSLVGTLKAPKNNPVFNGVAKLKLDMPSYDIYGSVQADIKIPPTSGWVFNSNTEVKFTMTDRIKSFAVTNMDANMLNALKFKGNFENTRKYNETGTLVSASGHLNGNVDWSFDYEYFKETTFYTISAEIDFAFNAFLETAYSDQNLLKAAIGGSIKSNGSLMVKGFGCTVHPYYSLYAGAELRYVNPDWLIKAEYEAIFGVEKIGEISLDGNLSKKID